uniref:Uncharacterized protein n=1 Tax=Anguilla anguilla TaxID=7936 RepID=A0A0E9WYR7_ANGAN
MNRCVIKPFIPFQQTEESTKTCGCKHNLKRQSLLGKKAKKKRRLGWSCTLISAAGIILSIKIAQAIL